MVLQGQMRLLEAESPHEASFKGRLSRIVLKLFGKVIKAEEAATTPYSSPAMDFEALLYTTEDMLAAAPLDTQRHREARDMAVSLMTSILKFRSAADVRELIGELGMSAANDGVWSVVIGLDPCSPSKMPKESVPASPSSRDVAHLVSAIGSAPEGPTRVAAVNALRHYREHYGDDALTLHLNNVSENFSEYIWEQLILPEVSPSKSLSRDTVNLPMSARIRDLRSRLSISDVAADDEGLLAPEQLGLKPQLALTPTKIPTPSRIPRSIAANNYRSTTVVSLRERLAAAQATGLKAADEVGLTSDDLDQLNASSHAAALRARLHAVRKQSLGSLR